MWTSKGHHCNHHQDNEYEVEYVLQQHHQKEHISDTRLLRRNIKVPVNPAVIAVPLLEPLIRLLEVTAIKLSYQVSTTTHQTPNSNKATHKALCRTKRTRMHTLKHQMFRPINPRASLLRRTPPRQKHDTIPPLAPNNINHLLRKLLPPLARMAVRLVRPHRQARVEKQHAAVGPRRQEAAVVGRGFEVGVVLFQRNVHVLERGRGGGRGADGEAQAVRLVDVMVWVLAENDGLDGRERRVP